MGSLPSCDSDDPRGCMSSSRPGPVVESTHVESPQHGAPQNGDEPLQGVWYSEADQRIVGCITDQFMIWDPSRFDQAPTKLYGTGKRGYKMDLLGDSYHAILEIGASVRLHWNDGESWVRMEQTNWETSCAPDLADQFQLKCTAEEEDDDNGQIKLALDTGVLPESFHPNASLTREDSYFDFRPAPYDGQLLMGTLELPRMDNIPLPPTCSSEAPMPERQKKLFDLYMKYAIKMEAGCHVDQVISNHETDKTHLQLLEDLMVLKVDQGSGHVIEFPMRGVSKVYRMVKYGNRWRTPNGPAPVSQKMRELAQEVVILEFLKRKLAFVFPSAEESLSFSMCFGLLVKRAQQRPRHTGESFQCGPTEVSCGPD